MGFTEESLIAAVRKRYRGNISLNAVREAVKEQGDFDEAVTQVMLESAMWDSPTGDPFDTTHVIMSEEERLEHIARQDRVAIMVTIWNMLQSGHQKVSDVTRAVIMQVAMRKFQMEAPPAVLIRRLVSSGFLQSLQDGQIQHVCLNVLNNDVKTIQNLVRDSLFQRERDKVLGNIWPLYHGMMGES